MAHKSGGLKALILAQSLVRHRLLATLYFGARFARFLSVLRMSSRFAMATLGADNTVDGLRDVVLRIGPDCVDGGFFLRLI